MCNIWRLRKNNFNRYFSHNSQETRAGFPSVLHENACNLTHIPADVAGVSRGYIYIKCIGFSPGRSQQIFSKIYISYATYSIYIANIYIYIFRIVSEDCFSHRYTLDKLFVHLNTCLSNRNHILNQWCLNFTWTPMDKHQWNFQSIYKHWFYENTFIVAWKISANLLRLQCVKQIRMMSLLALA